MSKISDVINYTFTQDVKAARSLNFKYTTIESAVQDVVPTASFGRVKRVSIGVKLHSDVWVSDTIASTDTPIQQALKDVKKAMIEEIFGEFRPLIADLRVATWNDDTMRVRELLNELEEKMFF